MLGDLAKRHIASKLTGLALTLTLALAMPSAGWADVGNPNAKPGPASEAQYDEYITEMDVPITMRDGVTLYADVYRPKAEGKFPVLVGGTPYTKINAMLIRGDYIPYATSRGYAIVVYDVRGQHSSEGEIDLHINLRNDGYDVIEWAAKQPWSNGRLAVDGASYDGQVAIATITAHPPHLETGIVTATSSDLFRQWYYRDGALESGFTTYWSGKYFSSMLANRLFPDEAEREEHLDNIALYPADPAAYLNVLPLADFEPSQMGDENFLKEWIAHNTDDEYWRVRNPETYFGDITIPVMHLGGWYDIFVAGTIQAFNDIQEVGATELARDNQKLFLGPWAHFQIPWYNQRGIDTVSEVYCGQELADYDHAKTRLDYFDYWLKDIQRPGFDPEERVHVWTFGANEWRSLPEYPLYETNYTNLYLNAAASGSSEALYDGSLSFDPPTESVDPITYEYDPMNPVATRGGNNLFPVNIDPRGTPDPSNPDSLGIGAEDQLPAELDTITFTTDVLTEATEVTGHIRATIYAATDCVDTDWVVRLSDVTPDGKSIVVADGIQRARYRESDFNPTLVEPGEIYAYDVDLWHNSWIFEPGHRIRVAITSSNWPRYSRNMNVAEQPELATEWKIANNSIYLDPEHASKVVLPIVSAKE